MIYFFLVLLAAVVAWRIILPGMRLEPRAGVAAPAAPVTVAPSGGWFTGYSKNIPSILLVIAGVVVFFVGVYNPTWSNPHPAAIGSWGRGHWFTLLIVWGIGAALIWLNASERAAKTLQTVLAGAVAAVLVVFPLWGWTMSPSAPAHATAESVQQPQRRKVSFPAYGETHRISVEYGYAPVFTGSGFELRCVYENGSEDIGSPTHPCRDGSVRYVVARDTSGQPNSVVYEFVQADNMK